MDDTEIQETVEAILGKGAKVVDCEKKSSINEEEVLLINGIPVTLEGRDGKAIKQALLTGQVPPCDLLNSILIKAGILQAPVKLETSLSVKSSVVTKEEITVAKGGKIVDERSRETKEDNIYTSSTSEIWEPVQIVPNNEIANECLLNLRGNNSSSSDSTIPNGCCRNHIAPGFGYAKNDTRTKFMASDGSIPNGVYSDSRVFGRGTDSNTSIPNGGVYPRNYPDSAFGRSNSKYSSDSDTTISNGCYRDSINSIPLRDHSDSSVFGSNKSDNKKKYNSVCTDSSGSSYESNDENHSPVLVKSGRENGTYVLPNSLSRDSGHDLTSVSATSTTRAGGVRGNTFTPTSVSSLSSLDETDFVSDLPNRFRNGCDTKNGIGNGPTIFGTVASDTTPKDGANRRSLPQTPQTSKSFSALYNGENGGPGLEPTGDSEVNSDNALVYRDGNLISGPLEALIQHMVPTERYYPDRAYVFAFLLSSRLFIKPHELLARICTLCDSQQRLLGPLTETEDTIDSTVFTELPPISGEEVQDDATAQFASRLLQLLAEWADTFPYDFRDERVMRHVRVISQRCSVARRELRSDVSTLLHGLLQRLTALEQHEEALRKMAESCIGETDASVDIMELCPHPGFLAQQLTHIELERLSFIGPEEFVQAFAKENPNIETSFKDMKKTRNLESYVQWFNRLSYLVATEVCKYPKKKVRVRTVEYWIETARECFNIGNFNSLMAIIAGLNMSPISRLKKTWNKIQSGKFSILEHQMDPSSNFSSYRSTLKAAMWRSAGARDERQRIVIPFFSLLVKDLYFLNEGCSNKLPNGHINFEKFWQLAKQVTEFMAWKQVTCPFEKNPKLIVLLQTSSVLDENALALASFECEQPENNQERERYKSLKAEVNTS